MRGQSETGIHALFFLFNEKKKSKGIEKGRMSAYVCTAARCASGQVRRDFFCRGREYCRKIKRLKFAPRAVQIIKLVLELYPVQP
mmetsp:Transcript_10727/g.28696  ORF Transcript_10727/g.28696 Transcript_10727/m.28696 type:complete len:85 (+) Transcript_10727:1603-1857(+)